MSSVDILVLIQVVGVAKCLAAGITLIRLLSCVTSHMVLIVTQHVK